MNIFIKLILSLPVLFFLPGYIFSAYLLKAKKKNNETNLSQFIFLSVLGSLILTSWIGLVMAELGIFSLSRLVITLWILCFAGAALNKFRLKPEGINSPKLTLPFFILIAILVIAGYLFFQPHELILGGRDPGVYVNTGINIAKTGSIFIKNRALDVLNSQDKIEFTRHFSENLMMGFYLEDIEKATITPQFFHIFSLWYAIFYSLFGLKLFLYMPPFFALLGIWAIYLFVRRVFNSEITALIAAGLLAINIIQIWFARFADAEIIAQFLLFSGLYLLSGFMKNYHRIEGLLGGLCFGLLFLLKIDLLLIIVPFLVLFGCWYLAGQFRRDYLHFLFPLIFLFIHSMIHALVFCRTYMHDTFWGMFWQQMTLIKFATIAFIVMIILLVFWKNFRKWLVSLFAKKEMLSKAAFIIAVCLIFYGYYVRPDLLSEPTDINTHSFRWMGWFLHPVGLLLAIGGFLLVLYRCRDALCFTWLFFVSIYSIQYFYKIRAFPDYFWLMRRFVPLIYPSAIIFISYLIFFLSNRLKQKKIRLIPYLIIILLIVSYINEDRKVLNVREFRGATEFVQQLSNELYGNSLVICQGPSADLVHLISLPLWSFNSLEFIEFRTPNFNPSEVVRLMNTWTSHYDSIFLLTSQKAKIIEADYYWGLIDEYRFSSPFMKFTYERPPKELVNVNIKVILRKLLTARELNPSINFIDIGEPRDVLIKSGFYHREKTEKESFRWTKEEATLYLPALYKDSNQLIIRMNSGRPIGAKPAQIQLFINDIKIADLELENNFKEYFIPLPPEVALQAEKIFSSILKIKSTTFIPAIEMGTADTRELGIMLDNVAME